MNKILKSYQNFTKDFKFVGNQPPQLDCFLLASTQIGVLEVPGIRNNPIIMDYFSGSGHDWVQDDELAWCGAFVNWVAKTLGYIYTGKLNARSWLDIGTEVEYPMPGDVVVLWRIEEDGPYGHVGFFVYETDELVYILGGNQDNSVCIKPYLRSRLLSIRRLTLYV